MHRPCTSRGAPAQETLCAGASKQPQLQPHPDRVRRRLEAILAEMRGEQKMAWDFSIQLVYQKIFPDMTHFLPEEEGARYRADFEREWMRLETA
ncbi:hypothetical protein [Methylocystis bryophila]|uniref:hypothetical protein n=1 Tax=Methylocystis bryophila TaxID=655015 RepID=UPI00131A3872|nr:hypothetical protein [Methylocystis bryophila]BDV37726.1 hypothetical protein DSM21852_09790 [Methylocystis bryophila]